MIGGIWAGVRAGYRAVFCFGLVACATAQTVSAADCPGHPGALGTSRTLVVDPREHPRIGTMQYAETLPLEDHEVVLTFDDGPLPRYSNQILEILAAQCVKATFFTVGRQAQANPEGVRKLRDAGHTVGTHTQNHPGNMHRLPVEQARQEIDQGIASVSAALGDGTSLAPFFRIPGLARAEGMEEYAALQGIQIWSADFPADDWRPVSSSRVYDLAIQRLEAKGRGILLLHDIQARTVAALPRILQELKARGYRIVHVVPATPEQPRTPTEPQQWQLHPPSEAVAISRWPKIPNFVFAHTEMLAAPSMAEADWYDGRLISLAETLDQWKRHAGGIPLPREAPWPRKSPLASTSTAAILPVPGLNLFELRDRPAVPRQAAAISAGHAEAAVRSANAVEGSSRSTSARLMASRRGRLGQMHLGPARKKAGSKVAIHGNPRSVPVRRSKLKHVVQVKKRSV